MKKTGLIVTFVVAAILFVAAPASAQPTPLPEQWQRVSVNPAGFRCMERGTWSVTPVDVVYRVQVDGATVHYQIKVWWSPTSQCGHGLAFLVPEELRPAVQAGHMGGGYVFVAPPGNPGQVIGGQSLACRSSINLAWIVCNTNDLHDLGRHMIWFSASGTYERDVQH